VNVLKPHLQTTVYTLLAAGKSQHQIARITEIDRKTIRGLARRFQAERSNSPMVTTGSVIEIPPSRPPGPISECEPHRAFIQAQLHLRRNYTAIYQDLVDQFSFSASYSSVKRFAATMVEHDPKQHDRLEFSPAEEVQVDYGEGALTLVPGTQRYRRPRLFIMTLRFSRRCFRRVVWKSSQEVWAQLHEQAWRYFGGSAQYCVLDNLKEGVIKPDLYEPELNSVYAAVLAHYGVVADPARVRDPDRKGAVENAIQHTQSTALKGRRFASIEEQNEFLENWETKWAAQRIHGSTRRQVEAMFQEERPFLKPLPVQSFQYFTEGSYTVGDDTCVRVDFSSYAARPAAIGSRVLVRLFDHHLEIRDLLTKSLLRTHTRSTKPGNVALPDAERLFNPSRETRRILAQARAIGPATEQLCQSLFDSEGRVGQRKMWGIVGLARHNPRRLIDRACAMALQDGVRSYKQIRALTERLLSEALADLNEPVQGELAFTQDDPLIRSGGDYADLFNLGAQASAALPPTLKEPAP
jgi:transposase